MYRLVVGLLTLCAVPPASAADPVAEFGRNYPAFARGQFTATTRMTFDPKEPPTVRVSRVHMDPPRWKVLDRESITTLRDGKPVTDSLQGESLIHASGMLSVSADYATGKALGGIAARVKPLPPSVAKTSGFGTHSFAVDSRTLLNDQKSLAELLAASNTRSEVGVLDGKAVTVIEATSKWGKLTLWLDPARGYLPLKVVQEKGAGDLIDDGQALQSMVRNEDGKPTPLDSHTQHFVTTRIESVGGRAMVTGFTRRASSRYRDGTATEYAESVALSEVKPVAGWDKNPFVLSTIVPNGTSVTAVDDKPIQYEWRGGQIVKLVNAATVASAGSHTFVLPAPRDRRWLWAAAAAGVVVTAGLIAWRPWRARRPA